MKYRLLRDLRFIKSGNKEKHTDYLVIKKGEIITSIPGKGIGWETSKWYSKLCSRDDNNVRRILFNYEGVIRTAIIGKDVKIVLE